MFAEALGAEGFNVWWDAVMHSGETFDEVIERNLRAAKAVVVLWSPRSVASRWVRAEATQADRANKLVPVIIEACERPIIFELTHTADLPEWKGDRDDPSWQSLVHDLRRLIGPAKEEAPAVEATPQPEAESKAPPPEAVKAAEPERVAPEAARASEEPKPAEIEPEPAKESASQDELAQALERLAKAQSSVLREPTRVEEVFKQSDEFRREEGGKVHCLRRVHADGSDAYHVITPDGLMIGRTRPADVIISDPSVSREHCVVEAAADRVRVMDLNSTNGTYIDNKRIGRAEILPVGSVLRVGNVSFEHEVRDRAEMRKQGDVIDFNPAARSQESRIARSS
jgi:hypothetical protein